MRFLSEEWLAFRLRRSAGFTLVEGVDIRMQHVVSGVPGAESEDGLVRYYDEVEGGRLARSGLGTIENPDFTLHNTIEDEIGVYRGDVDPYLVIVEGRVKVDGDHGMLLSFLPMLQYHSQELTDIALELLHVAHESSSRP
jgi:hypothetical protein